MAQQKDFTFAFKIAAALSKGFNNTFSTAQSKLSGLQKSYSEYEGILKGVNDAYKNGVINAESYNNAIDKIPKAYQNIYKTQKVLATAKNFIGDDGLSSMVYGKAARFVGKTAFASAKSQFNNMLEFTKDAREFEEAMADVKKVVDFETPQQFQDMRKDILNMTSEIPMAANELAQIFAAGGQAGIAKSELTDFAKSAAKMGVAFDITADQAGDMMAKWRTAFKMNQSDVVILADKINHLGNVTAASAPLISDVVTRIGPLGEVGGLASGEIAAMGASLIGSGVQSEVAATGLKNFILTMTSGTSATKKQAEAFTAIGLNAGDMAVKMQKDAKGAIIELLTALNGVDKVQQSAVLKELFGKESIAAIAPLLSNLDNLKKNFDAVADSKIYTGSMQKEFEARSETTANSLKLMEGNVKALKIAFGDSLQPTIKFVAEGIGSLAKFFRTLSDNNPIIANVTSTIITFAFGVTAIGAAAGMAIGYIKPVFTVGKRLFDLLRNSKVIIGIGQKLAGVWHLFSAALAGTPIGWILIGVSALIVVGTLLYRHWDKVKEFFTNLWESPAARIAMFVAGPIGWLFGAVTYVISHWDELKSYLQYFWDNPSAAIFRFQNYLKEQIQGAVEWVFKKWEELKKFLSNPISLTVAKNMLSSGRYDADLGGYEVGENASGGIYGKGAFLTTFAEESGESAIPHTPTKRNIGLLSKTNQIMGNPLQPTVNVYPQFNPVINAKAETPTVNVKAPAVAMPNIPPANVAPEIRPVMATPKLPEVSPVFNPAISPVVTAQKIPESNPVFNPIINAMASAPFVTVPPAVVKQPAINVQQADMTIPAPVIRIPESKPILQAPPVVKNIIQAVADSPIVKTFVKAVAEVPDVIVNPASPVLKPIFTAMAKAPDVTTVLRPVFNAVAPAVSPVIQATAETPNISPVFNPLFNVPKADTPPVKISQSIQAMAKTPAVTALFDPKVQTPALPDINVPQSTQKETFVERIRELVRPQGRSESQPQPINITFNPNIVINGNADRQEVEKATEISFQKLRELMEQLQREKRRVQYG